MDTNELHLLGVSFRTAPIEVREALSYTSEEASELLGDSLAESPETEALILSTCNRTEFYLAGPTGAATRWLRRVAESRPNAPIRHEDCCRYQLDGVAAARHLFRVACGLDSAILGDAQILGQVKQAYATAIASGTAGETLNRTLAHALRAGKRARSETALGRGPASVGSVLASMLLAFWSERGTELAPRILIIGAGDAACDIARHLSKKRAGVLRFVSRNRVRAEALAQQTGGAAAEWRDLERELAGSDIAITATSAKTPILTRELLDRLKRNNAQCLSLVVDASSPRNVEAGSMVEVINIDHIRERQETTLSHRQASVPEVQRLVEEEVVAWQQWRASRPVELMLKDLYQEASVISHQAAQGLLTPPPLNPQQTERLLSRSFNRLLHGHAGRLRSFVRENIEVAFPEGSVFL